MILAYLGCVLFLPRTHIQVKAPRHQPEKAPARRPLANTEVALGTAAGARRCEAMLASDEGTRPIRPARRMVFLLGIVFRGPQGWSRIAIPRNIGELFGILLGALNDVPCMPHMAGATPSVRGWPLSLTQLCCVAVRRAGGRGAGGWRNSEDGGTRRFSEVRRKLFLGSKQLLGLGQGLGLVGGDL